MRDGAGGLISGGMWLIWQIAVGVFLGVVGAVSVLFGIHRSLNGRRLTFHEALALALPAILVLLTVLGTEGPPPQWRWLFEDEATAASAQ